MSKNHHYCRLTFLGLCIVFAANLTLVTGCINNKSFVSVEDRFKYKPKASAFHQVEQGDTLFSIALLYGIDYRALASANSISKPYRIYPGQNIDVRDIHTPPKPKKTKPAKKSPKKAIPKKKKKVTTVKQIKKKPKRSLSKGIASWVWPSNGRLIRGFSTKEPINKGIDIGGSLGDSVVSAAAGTVVFAGQGLRGYGNLVIVEHNRQYLSAYAHVSQILVKEQETVKAGQIIAEIGSTGTDELKLHFEIRKNGKAVNPKQYLPAK